MPPFSVRVGFVTCVELGFSCIREIQAIGGRLDSIFTLHDTLAPRKAGRVFLDDYCTQHGIPLFKLRNINDPDALEAISARDLDWLFIIGWSQIARAELLHAPRNGVLGAHPTLLPAGRGRASIPWAIIKELPETGVTLFQLDEGVDTGPIIAAERIPLGARPNATALYHQVAEAHRALMRSVWPALARGEVTLVPQDEAQASVWPGRTPEDGRLTPGMSVHEADVLVRATTHPYPGAFIDEPEGRIRIWSGRPLVSDPAPEAGGGRVLTFRDGTFLAEDFAVEP